MVISDMQDTLHLILLYIYKNLLHQTLKYSSLSTIPLGILSFPISLLIKNVALLSVIKCQDVAVSNMQRCCSAFAAPIINNGPFIILSNALNQFLIIPLVLLYLLCKIKVILFNFI